MSDTVTNEDGTGEGTPQNQDGKAEDGKTVLADAIASEDGKAVDGKAEDGKAEDGKAEGDKDKDALQGAPEQYEDFKLPEGMEPLEVMGEFKDLAKKHNLTQEAAQGLVDMQTKIMQDQAQENVTYWENLKTEWLDTAKKDEEIGGDKFQGSVDGAKLTLQKFGTPALVEVLETYGLGNHPEIIRFANRINAKLGDDVITSGGATKGEKSLAQTMYPDNTSKGA